MKQNNEIRYHTIDSLNVLDRGLAYGDGLFETIAYVGSILNHWAFHWQRLKLGAQQLSIDLPEEQFFLDNLQVEINKELQIYGVNSLNNSRNKVIKIIVTRGQGGRGYLYTSQQIPSIIITVHNWPERDPLDYQSGIRVTMCETCLAKQPTLAGIKHLNRLEQVLGRNEFNETEYHEGIMTQCPDSFLNNRVNNESVIVEGTSSNLFFVSNGQLLTPLIDTCGVRGTMREGVLKLAYELGIPSGEGHYSLSDLSNASEVFLTNSIWGLLPVASIELDGELKWHQNSDEVSCYGEASYNGETSLTNKLAMILNKQIDRPDVFTIADN